MSHLPSIISDLAVILISAGLVSLLFKRLKQPVVLGYIVAGILAGPSIASIPTVSETDSIRIWADIGVVFLLFALGLDFSFKKLMKVGGTAVVGAVTVVFGMMSVGYTTGLSLGWGHMNSLFLGGMLSMSSTTIIFKAFEDMELRNKRFAGVVFGIVVKLGIFLLFSFVTGIYILPTFLRKARRFLNDETLLIVSVGLCLGMVILATKSGFSSALGAFVMGSILAETIEAERIEHVVKPVKNLFGAIFFVSVGMLIEPELLWQYKLPILFITLAVILGQILFSGFGILLSGQPLKIAIQSGFALAQIGEFAFIIASLGLSLKVTDNFLYPIVVAVSVITTFLTPYMIRLSEPAYVYADKHMPKSWRRFFDRYSSGGSTIKQKSTWNKLLKALMRIVVMYSAVSVVLILLWLRFVAPLIIRSTQGIFGEIISLVLILLIISPLLRAIMMKKNHSEEFQELWQDSKYNRGSLVSLIVLRIILCIGIVMIPIIKLLNITFGLVVAIAAASILLFILSKRLKKHSIQIERHFFRNLTARQEEMERRSPIKQHFANHLLARDLHLADFEIRQASPSVGKTLKELNFRQKCGVNVVTIIRGEQRINIPGGDERLYPFDKLIVVGTDKELESFLQYTEERYRQNQSVLQQEEVKEVSMEQFVISAGSKLIGLSIRQSGIRDNAACLVIGIERGVSSVMNPGPDTILEEGDIVWIVGERDKMVKLSEGETVGS